MYLEYEVIMVPIKSKSTVLKSKYKLKINSVSLILQICPFQSLTKVKTPEIFLQTLLAVHKFGTANPFVMR